MKKTTLLSIAIVGFAVSLSFAVQAKEFSGNGHVACLSEELLDQFVSASVEKDMQGIEYLLGSGCIMPRAGIQVSVLDRSWTGTAHVRAYVGDQAVELWTVNEALSD